MEKRRRSGEESRAMSSSVEQGSALAGGPLGKPTAYPEHYDATLLYPIARAAERKRLGLRSSLPFSGVDLWTAYELSWVNGSGKPQIAIGRFRVPADSPSIVESKSLKLYLGSFTQESIANAGELRRRIAGDLRRACGAPVDVELVPASRFAALPVAELPGESIDALDVSIATHAPDAAVLRAGTVIAEESLRSALFKSRCPVTGQPDFGDVLIRYRGPRIDRASLLRYVVSFRTQAAFHESCVERIFLDIKQRCAPARLTVYARFTRRGGIDINPFRSDFETAPSDVRTPRQ
jgi:7-cyano-7-deazaguanine reductase